MGVQFIDNSREVKLILERATVKGLEDAARIIKNQTVQNTPVDTGQLKGSWDHVVDESKLQATIGSPLENAIWTEFGTGEYALNRNGRKTPWRYQDAKGEWHTTTGKNPVRMLFNAFTTKKNVAIRAVEQAYKDEMK